MNIPESLKIPFWKNPVMSEETVLFLGDVDSAPLFCDPEEILSVTSYDRATVYTAGRDYTLTDGKLTRTHGSAIPYPGEEIYYPAESRFFILRDGEYVPVLWGEGDTMTRWQVRVTYRHKAPRTDFIPECRRACFSRLLGKLERGEDVVAFFYGDSVAYGASASFLTGVEPHLGSWSQQFVQYLAWKFDYTVHYVDPSLTCENRRTARVPDADTVFGNRGTITYINTSIGGWRVNNAIDNFDAFVRPFLQTYGCDLFYFGIGGNDRSLTPEEECFGQARVAEMALELAPDAEILLGSAFLGNPLIKNLLLNQPLYEQEMLKEEARAIARGDHRAVLRVSSLCNLIGKYKRYCDFSGNNINHPNDFLISLYAQCAIQTVLGYEE